MTDSHPTRGPDRLGSLELLSHLRSSGPFEEWRAGAEGEPGVPSKLLIRRAAPTRSDAALLSARLRASSAIAKQVEHHLVLHCFGTLEVDGEQSVQLFEDVDGEPLDRLIDAVEHGAAPFSLSVSVWLARQLLEALAHAHSLGIVHGALSPSLVYALTDGRLKMDFGLAALGSKREEPDDPAVTEHVDLRYGRPELAPNDPRRDLHAVACLLWELIAGRPYRTAIVTDASYRPAGAHRSGVPERLEATLKDALNERGPGLDARSFEDALTRIFYAELDADDERDGKVTLAAHVKRLRATQLPPVAETETAPAPRRMPSSTLTGRFTKALREREGPVQPQDFDADDVDVDPPQDSTWLPGMNIVDELAEEKARQEPPTVAVARVAGLPGTGTDLSGPGSIDRGVLPTMPLVDPALSPRPALVAPLRPPSQGGTTAPSASRSETGSLEPRRPSRPLWFLTGFTLTFLLLLLLRFAMR